MKRTLVSFLMLGLIGACGGEPVQGEPGARGDKGDPGSKGDPGQVSPSLQVVTPQALFAGRGAVLQLGGVGTMFASGSTVDFGDPAIKVLKVELGSIASLRVTIEVGPGARLGAHDITVTSPVPPAGGQGPEQVKLQGGFSVLASLLNVAPMGMSGPTADQGGFADVTARNLDYRDNPFYAGARFGGPLMQYGSATVSAASLSVTALVDALAPAGGLMTQASSVNPLGQTITYVGDPADPAAVKVKARPATALTAGMTKMGETLADRRATNLYKLTTTADNQALLLSFSGLGSGLSGMVGLVGFMAPASGRFADGASLATSQTSTMMGGVTAHNGALLLPKAGDYYFAVYASDLSGSMNHGYAVTAKTATAGALGSLKEPATPDSAMMPVASLASLDKPYFATDGAIDVAYEYDYFKFKAAKAGRVYLSAAGTPGVRLGLGLRAADCNAYYVATTYSSAGAVANEADVAADTTYCVRVTGDAATTPYQLLIVPSP